MGRLRGATNVGSYETHRLALHETVLRRHGDEGGSGVNAALGPSEGLLSELLTRGRQAAALSQDLRASAGPEHQSNGHPIHWAMVDVGE